MSAQRRSPIHDDLEHLHAKWGVIHEMPVALSFAASETERNIAQKLGLADVSALKRVTYKGARAGAWLSQQGIAVPAEIYGVERLDGGALCARTGAAEFFIEDGPSSRIVEKLESAPGANTDGVYRVLRQDASFLISGEKTAHVLSETCGYDFSRHESKIVYTRVAGVSCSILRNTVSGLPVYQLWLDNTYGPWLWHTLLEIVTDLGGSPVGLSVFYPGLTA